MKRTQLQRRTPLQAKKPIARIARLSQGAKKAARTRKRSRYRQRERQVDYMLWVKTLPCVARHLGPCSGVVEADHAGARGLGQKCSDIETIPICTGHHRERTDFSGTFKTWNKDGMRVFLAGAIASTQELWVRVFGQLPSSSSSD